MVVVAVIFRLFPVQGLLLMLILLVVVFRILVLVVVVVFWRPDVQASRLVAGRTGGIDRCIAAGVGRVQFGDVCRV